MKIVVNWKRLPFFLSVIAMSFLLAFVLPTAFLIAIPVVVCLLVISALIVAFLLSVLNGFLND